MESEAPEEVDDSDDLVDTATQLLGTIEIDRHTPLEIALLFSLLALQTRTTSQIKHIERKVAQMAVNLNAIQQAASDAADAANAAVALIEQLAADSNDPAEQSAIDAVTASLKSSTDALTASVQANTPVEPTPEPEPAPSA